MDSMKWQKMSFAEQIGNIGSEISRVEHWQKMKESKNKKESFYRVLELIDLTLKDWRLRFRLKEISRLREIVCDLIMDSNVYDISFKDVENFYLPFAIMARRK